MYIVENITKVHYEGFSKAATHSIYKAKKAQILNVFENLDVLVICENAN